MLVQNLQEVRTQMGADECLMTRAHIKEIFKNYT